MARTRELTISLDKTKPIRTAIINKVPKRHLGNKDGGFVAINKSQTSVLRFFCLKMVKHKVTVKFGPYMSCGIVEHRTARLEGLQGKNC